MYFIQLIGPILTKTVHKTEVKIWDLGTGHLSSPKGGWVAAGHHGERD